MTTPASGSPVSVGLIGAGRMGSFHAETLARRLPRVRLAAVADPVPGAAQQLADRLGGRALTDPDELLADPAVDAVVIVTPARTHAGLVEAAARAGKAVYCEKPMALTLAEADRAIAAADQAGVPLQVGFNRRYDAGFRAAHDRITGGAIGAPQLLRSLTRDPKLADPARILPWTIFLETLIHDFDALRFLNPGAEPVEVFALADALVRPDFKDQGLLDTAIVTVRFDNGALATAEASFQAVYGYDVRGEVLGSGGMVTVGELRQTSLSVYGADGVTADCVRYDQDLFRDAYVAELADFTDYVRTGRSPPSPARTPAPPLPSPRRHPVGQHRRPRAHRRAQGRVTSAPEPSRASWLGPSGLSRGSGRGRSRPRSRGIPPAPVPAPVDDPAFGGGGHGPRRGQGERAQAGHPAVGAHRNLQRRFGQRGDLIGGREELLVHRQPGPERADGGDGVHVLIEVGRANRGRVVGEVLEEPAQVRPFLPGDQQLGKVWTDWKPMCHRKFPSGWGAMACSMTPTPGNPISTMPSAPTWPGYLAA